MMFCPVDIITAHGDVRASAAMVLRSCCSALRGSETGLLFGGALVQGAQHGAAFARIEFLGHATPPSFPPRADAGLLPSHRRDLARAHLFSERSDMANDEIAQMVQLIRRLLETAFAGIGALHRLAPAEAMKLVDYLEEGVAAARRIVKEN